MPSCIAVARGLVLVWIVMVLAGCGGGGGGGGSDAPAAPQPNTPVVQAPSFTAQPQAVIVPEGSAASFSATVTGTGPFTYQWQRNGQAIPGATGSTYELTTPTLADHGAHFSVVVGNSAATVTSAIATLTVNPIAPTISQQPQAQNVLAGTTATFTVTATGSAPLSYQWRKNGVDIVNANSSTYITPAATLVDSGTWFDVVIANAAGNRTSDPAQLTVSPVVIPPSIATGPQSASGAVGAAIAFTVIADGTSPFAYQWYRNGTPIAGATGAILTVAPLSANNHLDQYTVAVSNSAGQATSTAAVLSVTSQAGQIDLIAGSMGGVGNADGTGASAHFHQPAGIAVDNSGNIFVADIWNYAIRKITPAGVVTLWAGGRDIPGSVDGAGTAARFKAPEILAFDHLGNLYVADGGTAIRKISPLGEVTTVAGHADEEGFMDGTGTAARFDTIFGLAVDSANNLYIADSGNNVIRKMTPAGVVSTFAGSPGQTGATDGTGASARFAAPSGMTFDAADNLYVVDQSDHTVRQITSAGLVTTIAGEAGYLGHTDGTGNAARFFAPVAIVADGVDLYVTELGNRIRKIAPGGVVTTFAGSSSWGSRDGVGTNASFNYLHSIAIDSARNLYVADRHNNTIRKITPAAEVSTFAGSVNENEYIEGSGSAARFSFPVGIAADANNIYVADQWNCAIRKISANGAVSSLVGDPFWDCDSYQGAPPIDGPDDLAVDANGNVYVADYASSTVYKVTPLGVITTVAGDGTPGHTDGIGTVARFRGPAGAALDGTGKLYITDVDANTLRVIDLSNNQVSTLAGLGGTTGATDGTGTVARFNAPAGIALDAAGNVYVADSGNHVIRKVTNTGVVTTVAGTTGVAGAVDGAAGVAQFNLPADVAIDSAGNLYVVDGGNYLIRKIATNGLVSTVAGTKDMSGQTLGPLPGSLNTPIGITTRTIGSGGVELLVTIWHGVISITLP